MHRTAIPLWVIFAATVCVFSIAMTSGSAAPPSVLAESHALYLEDAPGARGIAEVHGQVVGVESERAKLLVSLSAVGPGVLAEPGLAGVGGSNLRTAQEMERLWSDRAVRCALRSVDAAQNGVWRPGNITVHARGRIPERRVEADGTIDWDARHPARLPITLRCQFPAVAAGRFEAIVFAEEVPRLSVVFRHDGLTATLESLTSLGEHLPKISNVGGKP